MFFLRPYTTSFLVSFVLSLLTTLLHCLNFCLYLLACQNNYIPALLFPHCYQIAFNLSSPIQAWPCCADAADVGVFMHSSHLGGTHLIHCDCVGVTFFFVCLFFLFSCSVIKVPIFNLWAGTFKRRSVVWKSSFVQTFHIYCLILCPSPFPHPL